MGNSERKLTAKESRILITHWAGDAYDKLNSAYCDNLRYRCFQRTGCLITADGSDDSLISPEGLSGYKVLPPVPTQAPNEPVLIPTPTPVPAPEDSLGESEEDDTPAEQDEDLEGPTSSVTLSQNMCTT